jgi:hypothetical protein
MDRKTRKTSPRPNKSGTKSAERSAKFKAMWADPETRERWLASKKFLRETRGHTYKKPSRMGVPDGMRKDEAMALWEKSKAEARKFIQIMEEKDLLPKVTVPGSEEEMAKKVLEEAYVYAVGPLTDAKTKAAYMRVVLDFTKSKPESKQKLSLENSAEWLAALAADMPQREAPKKDADGGAQ